MIKKGTLWLHSFVAHPSIKKKRGYIYFTLFTVISRPLCGAVAHSRRCAIPSIQTLRSTYSCTCGQNSMENCSDTSLLHMYNTSTSRLPKHHTKWFTSLVNNCWCPRMWTLCLMLQLATSNWVCVWVHALIHSVPRGGKKNTSDPSCPLICTFFTAFPLPLGRAGTAIRSTAVTSILTGLVTKSLKESKTWVRLIYLVHVLARMIHWK